ISIIESAHQTPIETHVDLPLWRLIVVMGKDLQTIEVAFLWHHAMGDGVSGFVFHQTFLHALNNVKNSLDTIIEIPHFDLLPSLEEAHPLPTSITYLITSVLKRALPTAETSYWSGPVICSTNKTSQLRV